MPMSHGLVAVHTTGSYVAHSSFSVINTNFSVRWRELKQTVPVA